MQLSLQFENTIGPDVISMKHLYIVRHGSCAGSDLNDKGKAEMRKIAEYIKQNSNGSKIYLASSDVRRAIDSAKVISDELHLSDKFDKNSYLYEGPNKYVMDLINNKRQSAEVFVIVGHLDFVDSFPTEFVNAEFNSSIHIRGLNRGEAVHINLENRVYQILSK